MTLNNLVKDIYQAIQREPRAPVLRLSAIGQPCSRRLWYMVNEPDSAEPMEGSQKLRFEYGNLLEKQILDYVKAAGYRVELEQHEVEIEGVKGHIDCLIDGCLVDVKTASASGFGKFRRGELHSDDPFGYLDQINAYHWALRDSDLLLDKSHVYFLAVDKSNGGLVLDAYPINGHDYSEVVKSKQAIVDSVQLPERSYTDVAFGTAGNKVLPSQCSFCDFKRACWGNLIDFSYASGKKYFTKLIKRPRVDETIKEPF